MATYTQRAASIVDAVLNSTATAAQKQRIGDAFSRLGLAFSAAGAPMTGTLTPAQISEIFVKSVRNHIISVVKTHEAQAVVQTAQSTAHATIDTDFPEAP